MSHPRVASAMDNMASIPGNHPCSHCRQQVAPIQLGGKHYCPNCGSVWVQEQVVANRSVLRGWLLRVTGLVVLIAGVAIDYASIRQIREAIGWFGGAVVFIIGSGLLVTGNALWTRGKKVLARTADEVLLHDTRPPVVYLRSFQDDLITKEVVSPPGFGGLRSWGFTEEEQLAKVLSKIGPLIALGRPGDDRPNLGAARTYVSDEQWRQTITDYMSEARVVVLRVGATKGLWWELQQAVTRLSPEQLVFLVPDDQKAYQAFRLQANAYLPKPLPEHVRPESRPPRGIPWTLQGEVASQLSLSGLIYFTADWTPQAALFEAKHAIGTPRVAVGPFMYGLRPVFRQLGVPWRWINRTTIGWIAIPLLFISLIVLALIFDE